MASWHPEIETVLHKRHVHRSLTCHDIRKIANKFRKVSKNFTERYLKSETTRNLDEFKKSCSVGIPQWKPWQGNRQKLWDSLFLSPPSGLGQHSQTGGQSMCFNKQRFEGQEDWWGFNMALSIHFLKSVNCRILKARWNILPHIGSP